MLDRIKNNAPKQPFGEDEVPEDIFEVGVSSKPGNQGKEKNDKFIEIVQNQVL